MGSYKSKAIDQAIAGQEAKRVSDGLLVGCCSHMTIGPRDPRCGAIKGHPYECPFVAGLYPEPCTVEDEGKCPRLNPSQRKHISPPPPPSDDDDLSIICQEGFGFSWESRLFNWVFRRGN